MNFLCNAFAIWQDNWRSKLNLAHQSRREKPMTNVMSITFLIVSLATVWPLHARDTRHLLPIAAALETKDAQDKLEGSVKFFSAINQRRRS
jgi:hypothetical protein